MTTATGKVPTTEYIADRWPRLFHVAAAGSWPSIQAHGLLSTSALLDLFEVSGAARDRIESRRRPESRINASEPVVELTVPYSVPDITDLVIDVRERN